MLQFQQLITSDLLYDREIKLIDAIQLLSFVEKAD